MFPSDLSFAPGKQIFLQAPPLYARREALCPDFFHTSSKDPISETPKGPSFPISQGERPMSFNVDFSLRDGLWALNIFKVFCLCITYFSPKCAALLMHLSDISCDPQWSPQTWIACNYSGESCKRQYMSISKKE